MVATIAITTFFGGYAIGTMDSNSSVTTEELEKIISEIEIKTSQISQVPTQLGAQSFAAFKTMIDTQIG